MVYSPFQHLWETKTDFLSRNTTSGYIVAGVYLPLSIFFSFVPPFINWQDGIKISVQVTFNGNSERYNFYMSNIPHISHSIGKTFGQFWKRLGDGKINSNVVSIRFWWILVSTIINSFVSVIDNVRKKKRQRSNDRMVTKRLVNRCFHTEHMLYWLYK